MEKLLLLITASTPKDIVVPEPLAFTEGLLIVTPELYSAI
jgi:hypothetical protein